MGLADQAMAARIAKPKEPAPEEDKPTELGIALDELFSLKGKEREAAFKAAVALCSSDSSNDDGSEY